MHHGTLNLAGWGTITGLIISSQYSGRDYVSVGSDDLRACTYAGVGKSRHWVPVVINCASWIMSGCYHKDWYTLWWDQHRVSTRKRGPIDTDIRKVNTSKEPIDRVVRVHLTYPWQLGRLRWNPHNRCTPEGYHNCGDWDHVIILSFYTDY